MSFELTSCKLSPEGRLLCVSSLRAELCCDTRVPVPGQNGSGSAPWQMASVHCCPFPLSIRLPLLVSSTNVMVLSTDWERRADTDPGLCAHSVPRFYQCFYQCKSDLHSAERQSFLGHFNQEFIHPRESSGAHSLCLDMLNLCPHHSSSLCTRPVHRASDFSSADNNLFNAVLIPTTQN